MKKTLLVSLIVFVCSSFSNSKKTFHIKTNNLVLASSILYVSNVTANTIIISITIDLGGSNVFTVTTNIPPDGSFTINLGNTDHDITITLNLSATIDGTINDRSGTNDGPLVACKSFLDKMHPHISFHFYSVNYLVLIDVPNKC